VQHLCSDASKVLVAKPERQNVLRNLSILMPTHNAPTSSVGTEILGNTPRGPNLRPIQRQQMISKAEAGVLVRELVEEFGRSPICIRTTLRLSKTRATTQEAPRSVRPPILSLRTKKEYTERLALL
jgi:hypothetical protein